MLSEGPASGKLTEHREEEIREEKQIPTSRPPHACCALLGLFLEKNQGEQSQEIKNVQKAFVPFSWGGGGKGWESENCRSVKVDCILDHFAAFASKFDFHFTPRQIPFCLHAANNQILSKLFFSSLSVNHQISLRPKLLVRVVGFSDPAPFLSKLGFSCVPSFCSVSAHPPINIGSWVSFSLRLLRQSSLDIFPPGKLLNTPRLLWLHLVRIGGIQPSDSGF